ncbi:MAG TPA: hypothetical protein VG815_02200 [Chloroflexota bacterium]|nr:hypothetical protein [Chloroflexota bacterium]
MNVELPATFLLLLLLVALWPLGVVCALGLFVAALRPNSRRYVRAGAVWGLVGAVVLCVPFVVLGELGTEGDVPGWAYIAVILKVFSVGFALGTLIWYLFRFRRRGRATVV